MQTLIVNLDQFASLHSRTCEEWRWKSIADFVHRIIDTDGTEIISSQIGGERFLLVSEKPIKPIELIHEHDIESFADAWYIDEPEAA